METKHCDCERPGPLYVVVIVRPDKTAIPVVEVCSLCMIDLFDDRAELGETLIEELRQAACAGVGAGHGDGR